MPRAIEPSRSVNIPVRLCTRQNFFLIRSSLSEKLAMPGDMNSERTSELAYPAKLLPIQ